jgi:hypothetical protein
MFISSLISEEIKLLHYFHFLAAFRSIGNVENFGKSKCTCTSQNVTNIVLFADVVDKQKGFGDLLLQLHILY